ncbi:hypothetical protein CR513_16717, partial [Mucuna pruriens]
MKNFEMKDLGETFFVLDIQILRDHSQESLMYTQVCTRFDIAFVVGVLGRKVPLKPNNGTQSKEVALVSFTNKVVPKIHDLLTVFEKLHADNKEMQLEMRLRINEI